MVRGCRRSASSRGVWDAWGVAATTSRTLNLCVFWVVLATFANAHGGVDGTRRMSLYERALANGAHASQRPARRRAGCSSLKFCVLPLKVQNSVQTHQNVSAGHLLDGPDRPSAWLDCAPLSTVRRSR